VLYYAIEAVQKGLVALIPVVVARRVRYGGPVRPAEFLALNSGVARLLLSFERLPALGLVTRMPGKRVHYQVNIALYDLWIRAELVVCVLAVALAVRFRKRLAPWVTGCLLLGPWVALAPIEWFVHEARDAILERIRLPYWGVRVFDDLVLMPISVLTMIPLVLAVADAVRMHRPRPTWVERACLALALIWFLGVRLRYYSQMSLNQPGSASLILIAIDLVELVVAAAVCVVVTRRYGPAVGRWFGLVESHET
jgi:hypothetical protein